MQIDPKDLGWIGAVKAIVNCGVAVFATWGALTFEKDLSDSGPAWAAFAFGLLGVCGFVEWLFRGWHQERVDMIKAAEAKIGNAWQERVAGRNETIDAFREKGKGKISVEASADGTVLGVTPLINPPT